MNVARLSDRQVIPVCVRQGRSQLHCAKNAPRALSTFYRSFKARIDTSGDTTAFCLERAPSDRVFVRSFSHDACHHVHSKFNSHYGTPMRSGISCGPNVGRATSLDRREGTAPCKARMPTASRSMHLGFLRLSLFSSAYALCVHSFSFPFFLPPPSSLQITQSSLITKQSELFIPAVGNLLVHISYVGSKIASPVVHSDDYYH